MTNSTPPAEPPAPGGPPEVPPGAGASDLERWQARYARTRAAGPPHDGGAPSSLLAAELGALPGGGRRALDLACGAGRHSVWLAGRGWRVTGVDFAPAGLARARDAAASLPAAARPRFVSADLEGWRPDDGGWDLIVLAYFHLPELLRRVPAWLAPGGRLLVLTHAPESPAGPANPRYRPTLAGLRESLDASGIALEYLRADTAGDPDVDLVTVVHARRPEAGAAEGAR
ncbi:class I SAM-dependent methyltransferase [Arthrobacter halodurans]|uniref:Class I SAM-dependent methyltransferase n=1 Tax=Arthrobacter halodurans TaxID=516699 RepID=A0ABV4UN99_9MICC